MTFVREARVGIRPVTPTDYQELHRLATTPGIGDRWRNYAPDITFEDFVEGLWAGALENDIVYAVRDGASLGLVSAYGAEHRSRTCSIAVVEFPQFVGTGLALAGAGLLINELFREWAFRKLYVEMYDFNLSVLGSIVGHIGVREAVLKDEVIWQGELRDQHIITIDREAWAAGMGEVLTRRIEQFRRAMPAFDNV